jgi:hypothetical protein
LLWLTRSGHQQFQHTPLGRAFRIGGYTQQGGEGWRSAIPLSAMVISSNNAPSATVDWKQPMRLTARKIKTLTARGLYADGGNLYLKVGEKPSQRSWVFRYMIRGRARSMGLGDADIVSLVEAWNKRDDAFRQVRAGQDPLDERATTNAKGRAPTFKDAAQQYSAARAPGWGAKHLSIWRASVATYAEPIVGSVPVERIDTDLVLKVLQPIWQTKTETASRLRGRIEMVLTRRCRAVISNTF